MASGDSNVVRIVNLDDTFTEEILKNCILINCRPEGDVKKIYLKRDDKTKTSYGYVVFENSYDALKMTQTLNGHIYISNKLEIELIGPNLKYRIYGKDNKVLRLLGTTGTVLKTHTRQNLDGLLARRQSALNRKRPSSASNIERARNKRVPSCDEAHRIPNSGSKYIPPHMRNRNKTIMLLLILSRSNPFKMMN
ncbi:uncharacterized protein LOC111691289 isoform X2 [Anoplophora glabripennis]|uniref:uncharacterized protein LOC111691289 isoform X2 n=1 Tax=Anoplophora glabripennis TaxID=217634 RepID=UPI000C77DC66|nr:uncharacterized protein LOC111691289 isoform X2 [Anoplophora glabripennis]